MRNRARSRSLLLAFLLSASLAIVVSCGGGDEGGEGGTGGVGGTAGTGGTGGSKPGRCGDGVVDTGEGCDDGNDEDGDGCTATCTVEEGWTCTGAQGCTPICGDGLILGDEECDGEDFGGMTCEDYGYTGGNLTCNSSCRIDTAQCTNAFCGNGVKDGAEQCDGADVGGANCQDLDPCRAPQVPACTPSCTLDWSTCTQWIC